MAVNVSVVVPTYKEAANLKALTTRLFAAVDKSGQDDVELIIVDDNSPDETKAVCDKLKAEGYKITLIVRTTERGLSSAVLRGFEEAKGSVWLRDTPACNAFCLKKSLALYSHLPTQLHTAAVVHGRRPAAPP